MKASTILSVVASATLAAAQLNKFPPCALTCAISSIGTSGCNQTDIACICRASTFLSGIRTCIEAPGACTPAEVDQTIAAASVLCAQAGVTITPPGGSAPTTSAPASTAAPAPTTTTTEAAPTTTAPATSAPATSAPAAVSSSSSVAVVVPPTYGTTSSVITMTTTTTICPSSTSAAVYVAPASNTTVVVPPPTYTGAAVSVAANAGAILIAAGVAMFFA